MKESKKSRGNFNGKPLESYQKKDLIEIIVWLSKQSERQIKELEDDMKYVHEVSGLYTLRS